MNMADLEDYHPLYKALPTYKGKIWGFFDDGDMFALYYRKDIFEDPKLKEAYQAKFGKALEVPKTWEDYAQVAQFITDQIAPRTSTAPAISARPAAPATSSTSCSSSGPTAASSSTRHEGAACLGRRREDLEEHDRRQQGLDPRQQRARRRFALGGMAPGQGGDDLFVAADRAA